MDNHVVVQLDGRNVQVGGATSVLPTLPPGQMVEVCLSRYGRHTIAGQVVTFREGQPVRGERFSDPDVHFGSDPSGVIPYHRYGITGQIVRRHRIR
ncbi:MAG: hypothetical protein U9Q03_01090 [Patescibacteria group bacterium]|nr:hypothetical protein [Patescibacteria group bacterium]